MESRFPPAQVSPTSRFHKAAAAALLGNAAAPMSFAAGYLDTTRSHDVMEITARRDSWDEVYTLLWYEPRAPKELPQGGI
jgi:hypothetical protein